MAPTRKRVHKYRATPPLDRCFYNIRKEYNIVLYKLRHEIYMDEKALVKLITRLTLLIERLIQKECQIDKGILMNEMLKLEADLTITLHLLQVTESDYVILEPESPWLIHEIKWKILNNRKTARIIPLLLNYEKLILIVLMTIQNNIKSI